MDKEIYDSAVSDFLDDVTEQIAYKPLRPSIRQELEAHIEDRVDEYRRQGNAPVEAIDQAIRSMGDAVCIGTELNAAHHIQKAPDLALAASLLFLAGIALSFYFRLQWIQANWWQYTPGHMINNFGCYLAGGILFVFTVIKGYPLLIQRRKVLTGLAVIIYLFLITAYFRSHFVHDWIDIHSTANVATLMFTPFIAILLYCLRRSNRKLILISLGFFCIGVALICLSFSDISNYTLATLLMSILCTICFMIHRNILPGRKKHFYPIIIMISVLLGFPLIMAKDLLLPRAKVENWLDNTYNGILLKELLSKTPLTHGLSLTRDELMSYGTGTWCFTSQDSQSLYINAPEPGNDEQNQTFSMQLQDLADQHGYPPKIISYTTDNVTLWRILPQHYTDYLPALLILLFGWLPGLMINGIIIWFYVLMFKYILQIHGHLTSSLAFACGQCLLWQGIVYVLGYFSYGYRVTSLPLISEGGISILFNMLLLGLIFSAYRYDHVIEEPLELTNLSTK